MSQVLVDLIVHGAPALLAGAGCYFGVKYAIKDHAQRLDMILTRQTWMLRKFTAMATRHNDLHPGAAVNIDDFPDNEPGAFRV